jgi:uncharacterized phiE125 gp8 family phage protein
MDAITNFPDNYTKGRPLYNAVLPGGYQNEAEPVTEPVTVAEVKEELQIDFTDHDTYLGKLITRMRRAMERYCGISMVPKEVVAFLKNEMGNIELPHGPAIAGTISLTDINATELVTGSYYLRSENDGIYLETKYDWVRANYDAGYGAVGNELPEDMKDALIRIVAHVFTHRADEGIDTNEVIKKFAHQFKRNTWLL